MYEPLAMDPSEPSPRITVSNGTQPRSTSSENSNGHHLTLLWVCMPARCVLPNKSYVEAQQMMSVAILGGVSPAEFGVPLVASAGFGVASLATSDVLEEALVAFAELGIDAADAFRPGRSAFSCARQGRQPSLRTRQHDAR